MSPPPQVTIRLDLIQDRRDRSRLKSIRDPEVAEAIYMTHEVQCQISILESYLSFWSSEQFRTAYKSGLKQSLEKITVVKAKGLIAASLSPWFCSHGY